MVGVSVEVGQTRNNVHDQIVYTVTSANNILYILSYFEEQVNNDKESNTN